MDTPEVDALQNELGSLTCEEQKPSQLKKLPPCVFIALAQRYLTATQRAALAASERYAREELVKKGEIVWRVTWISQTAAVRMLSTVPPRAYDAAITQRREKLSVAARATLRRVCGCEV